MSSFHDQVVEMLPKLRAQALALTRDSQAAHDLVQDAVVNALAAQHSFTPGTNFAAWIHRIARNQFISNLRKRRPTVEIDETLGSALAVPGNQEDSVVLGELLNALQRLPTVQRESLMLIVGAGHSYEEVAAATGCRVGTAKSRVFRARATLAAALLGELGDADDHRNEVAGARDAPAVKSGRRDSPGL